MVGVLSVRAQLQGAEVQRDLARLNLEQPLAPTDQFRGRVEPSHAPTKQWLSPGRQWTSTDFLLALRLAVFTPNRQRTCHAIALEQCSPGGLRINDTPKSKRRRAIFARRH
jgi:hypothetical protein